MKYGVCYYVLGCIEPHLEFVEDESLEAVIHRVKTNDFTGVRFARAGLDKVPHINICDDCGYCLYRIPVTELQHNDFGYILDNYGDDEADDVENNTASEQDNTVEKSSKKTNFFQILKKLYRLTLWVLIALLSFVSYRRCFYILTTKEPLDPAIFRAGGVFALDSISWIIGSIVLIRSFVEWLWQLKVVENIKNRFFHNSK